MLQLIYALNVLLKRKYLFLLNFTKVLNYVAKGFKTKLCYQSCTCTVNCLEWLNCRDVLNCPINVTSDLCNERFIKEKAKAVMKWAMVPNLVAKWFKPKLLPVL